MNGTGRHEVITGCCGFPEAMDRYFSEFRAVEVQKTFYKPPSPATASRWRESAPPGFTFCLKAWQLITHTPASPTYRRLGRDIDTALRDRYGNFRLTDEVLSAWETTLNFARALEAELVVFQCPRSFKPTSENVRSMRRFFATIRRDGLVFAWEPRGDWPAEIIVELCRELELVHCVDPFKDEPLAGDLHYFRLHGIGGYRHRYSAAELDRLAGMTAGKKSYVMFNNLSMLEDARRFKSLVEQGV